jgi:hypothetical protein
MQHPAHPVKVTSALVAIVVGVWLIVVVVAVMYSRSRLQRARAAIRAALEQAGYDVLQMEYRHFRLGLFSLWNTSRSQDVYRVMVRDRSTGEQLTVWARYGRSWLASPVKLEFRCDSPTATSRLPEMISADVSTR